VQGWARTRAGPQVLQLEGLQARPQPGVEVPRAPPLALLGPREQGPLERPLGRVVPRGVAGEPHCRLEQQRELPEEQREAQRAQPQHPVLPLGRVERARGQEVQLRRLVQGEVRLGLLGQEQPAARLGGEVGERVPAQAVCGHRQALHGEVGCSQHLPLFVLCWGAVEQKLYQSRVKESWIPTVSAYQGKRVGACSEVVDCSRLMAPLHGGDALPTVECSRKRRGTASNDTQHYLQPAKPWP